MEKYIYRKENLKKCTSFEDQKGTRHIRGNMYFGINCLQLSFITKQCPRFLLIYFAREIQGFYQSFLENQVDFRDIMNVSPNILAKYYNFEKLRHSFADERVLIRMTLIVISSCHLKTLVHFCLQKKGAENAYLTLNSKLSQNRREKQTIPSKTTINWLFNDI